jgi:hypothetical protein
VLWPGLVEAGATGTGSGSGSNNVAVSCGLRSSSGVKIRMTPYSPS